MIDLRCSRAELLARIGARQPLGDAVTDITDPRLATSAGCVRLSGHDPEALFRCLRAALSARFAAVPPLELTEDLLMPLRNALGNAFKHGNGRDATKSIQVEIVLGATGAFAAVSDEGPGFDFTVTLDRLRQNETYFENYGAGFRNFIRSRSTTVSYEAGGRTVLLGYQPPPDPDPRAPDPEAGTAAASDEAAGDPLAATVLDAGWMAARLSAELPEFNAGRATLASCAAYARKPGEAGNTYVLRVGRQDGTPDEPRILTGRVHATEARAADDFTAATRLYESWGAKGVQIPRPVARLVGEPRLVLYDFYPWMNLWDFFTFFTARGGMSAVRHTVGRMGHMLATLHRCDASFPLAGRDVPAEIRSTATRLETALHRRAGGAELAGRFSESVRRIQESVASGRTPPLAPTHGAFGWDCVHYGCDNCFYLFRFEDCRRSDPRLDAGRFLADLLCFTHGAQAESAFGALAGEFLREYNSLASHPLERNDLAPAVLLPVLEGFDRTRWLDDSRAEQLLAAVNAVSALRKE
jgi:anti-sigma regulatory factor (Ser/Thr protein kinase)